MLDGSRRWTVAGVPAWGAAAVVVAAYSLAALAIAWLTHRAAARPFTEAARDLWLAAMIWAGLTAGIYQLVLRYPASRLGYRRAIAAYGAVIVGASWVVNGAFMGLYVLTGLSSADDPAGRWHTLSVLNLPFNAAGAVALIAAFHWMRAAGTERASGASPRKSMQPQAAPESLAVTSGTRQFTVPVDTIELIEAADDYVFLHCDSGSHLCNARLYRLEQTLAPAGFVRAHRSALVNLNHVATLSGQSRGRLKLELSSGRSVAVSRRRQAAIRRAVLTR